MSRMSVESVLLEETKTSPDPLQERPPHSVGESVGSVVHQRREQTKVKKHALSGRKQSAETIEKRKQTMAAKRAAKNAVADMKMMANGHDKRDASVYLRHALDKWPTEKRGIARLYVELALATLEGKA